jgi:choline dehydrogenase
MRLRHAGEPGNARDIKQVTRGLGRVAGQIGGGSAYDPRRSAEAAPGPAADDDDALRNFAKAAYQSYSHPVGACAMGDTDMSVVDSELRVHGISGLRSPTGPSCRRSRRPTRPRRSMRAAELIGG